MFLPVALPLLASASAPPAVEPALRTGLRSPKDAALVIGIEDYFVLPDVAGAVGDAALIAGVLTESRGIPAERVHVLSGGSRELVLEEARKVAQEAAGGTAWLYFAGHGAASPRDGERMLLGDDVRPDLAAFEARAVRLDELQAALSAQGASTVLLVDACYTGLDRDGAAILDKRFAVPTWARPPDARVLEWQAAAAGEWSGRAPGGDHGAFTYAVAGALRGWADGVDGAPDGVVTAEEADRYVGRLLGTLGVRDQHPVLRASDPGAWALVSGKLEPAPELAPVVTRPTAQPEPGAFLDDLARVAAEQARLQSEHEERTRIAVDAARTTATGDWDKATEIARTDEALGEAAVSAWLARWKDATVDVDGVAEPIRVPEVPKAEDRLRELRLSLALRGEGLVGPLRPVPDSTRWMDADGRPVRNAALYDIVTSVSDDCAAEVVHRKRSKTASWLLYGLGGGGLAAGAGLLFLDPDFETTNTTGGDSKIASIGPLGITGISAMIAGPSIGLVGGLVLANTGPDGSDEGFSRCVRKAL